MRCGEDRWACRCRATGNAGELEAHLILAGRVDLLRRDVLSGPLDECERISKMLRSLIRSLEVRI
jgi:four helix bundle protein